MVLVEMVVRPIYCGAGLIFGPFSTSCWEVIAQSPDAWLQDEGINSFFSVGSGVVVV